jgi:NitT/TauT family transport system ATP-binding protein
MQRSDQLGEFSIQAADVSRVFPGGVRAVEALSLEIADGDFVAILGPSGCGKSTVLRMIAGLDWPSGGRLSISDRYQSKIAYVFQDAHLLPWRNVLRNVELPLELAGVGREQRREKAISALNQVGLGDALGRYPGQLSGGMRMRVSLARAMATDPQLLLLDEPFAALDEITRQRLDEQLRELWLLRKMTVLFVTHSTAEAVFLARRAIVMTGRPGRIVLDRQIDLPVERTQLLRGTAEFAMQTADLYAALASGGV